MTTAHRKTRGPLPAAAFSGSSSAAGFGWRTARRSERISFPLQVDGIFAIATGFTTGTQLSRNFQTLLDDMTSPNLRNFLSGNFMLGTVVTPVMVEGAEPEESPVSACPVHA